jgi:hypothetical protein
VLGSEVEVDTLSMGGNETLEGTEAGRGPSLRASFRAGVCACVCVGLEVSMEGRQGRSIRRRREKARGEVDCDGLGSRVRWALRITSWARESGYGQVTVCAAAGSVVWTWEVSRRSVTPSC